MTFPLEPGDTGATFWPLLCPPAAVSALEGAGRQVAPIQAATEPYSEPSREQMIEEGFDLMQESLVRAGRGQWEHDERCGKCGQHRGFFHKGCDGQWVLIRRLVTEWQVAP